MILETPAISIEYVRVFLKMIKSLGYPDHYVQEILGASEQHFTQQGNFVSTRDLLGMITRGLRLIGDFPHAGLMLGDHMTLTTHGMAGIAALTQSTYRDALLLATRTCDSVFPALKMTVEEDAGEVSLVVMERLPLGEHFKFFVELIFVNFYNIMHFLLGNHVEPARLCFSYAAPEYVQRYARYFNCPLQFDAKQSAYVVPRSVASMPLSLASKQVSFQAETQVVKEAVIDLDDGLIIQVRKFIKSQGENFPSLEDTARHLMMSGRTLRRQLHLLDTSYQKELDEVRRELSFGFLARNDISITEIAISLGFNDSSAFCRAFKGWTGETPSDFRRRIGSNRYSLSDIADYCS